VGSRGDSYDNALAEAVNAAYKTELINRGKPWRCLDDVELSTTQWVAWYNQERLHEALGYRTPAEYETALSAASHLASQPTPALEPTRNKTWGSSDRPPDLTRIHRQ
jgi:putative transposase